MTKFSIETSVIRSSSDSGHRTGVQRQFVQRIKLAQSTRLVLSPNTRADYRARIGTAAIQVNVVSFVRGCQPGEREIDETQDSLLLEATEDRMLAMNPLGLALPGIAARIALPGHHDRQKQSHN
jgi:hypothetical protein